MSTRVLATLLIEDDLHRALTLRAADSNQTLSEFVNIAVRRSLMADAASLRPARRRSRKSASDRGKVAKSTRRSTRPRGR